MINEEFYAGKVCSCPQPTHVTPVNSETFKQPHEMLYLYKCSQCGLLERARLYKCKFCQSAFYRFFMHPRQGKGGNLFCWNCLESGKSYGPTNWYESKFPKVPPPDFLIQPVTEPPTAAEISAQLDALLESLDQ
jgi:hypothetical protein